MLVLKEYYYILCNLWLSLIKPQLHTLHACESRCMCARRLIWPCPESSSPLQVLYLTICTALVGCWPDDRWKPKLVQRVLIHCFSVLSSALSPVVTYHNERNKPKAGICVANHTSPIDALVLMCDNCYSLVSARAWKKISSRYLVHLEKV